MPQTQNAPSWAARLLFLLILALIVFNAISAFCAESAEAPPPAVVVAAVQQKDVHPVRQFVGRVEAIQSVDLRARVQGYLDQICFLEGGLVKAGQTMFVIEQASYRNQVDSDRAKMAQAQAALAQAEQYLARLKSAGRGSVSATDMDSAVSSQLQAKAALAQAKAALAQAELNLSYTTVKAPIGGRIGRAYYTKGNLVGPDSGALARIVQIDPIRVVYSISETDLPSRSGGDLSSRESGRQVRLKFDDERDFDGVGRVEFIDNEVDVNTGTIAVRAVFNNPGGKLVPGQFVIVCESLGPEKLMVVVPQTAVLEDQNGRSVLVVDGQDMVSRRAIVTIGQLGADWIVKSGLTPGELIVVQGVQKAKPGQKVKPVATAAQ